MNTPAPIAFLTEFLDWSTTDGRVGEVRHSALLDQANAAITAFNTARSPSLESLKATFEAADSTFRDASIAFAQTKKLNVLLAVRDRAEAEYMIAFYQVQYAKADDRWSEALRNLNVPHTTIILHQS